jgi:hypothetical protein
MYFEARSLAVPAAAVSLILLLTIFLSPLGLIAFLAVRSAVGRRSRGPGRPVDAVAVTE